MMSCEKDDCEKKLHASRYSCVIPRAPNSSVPVKNASGHERKPEKNTSLTPPFSWDQRSGS